MKALENTSNTEASFVIYDNEKHSVSDSSQIRNKNRVFEHIFNGIDVILVTSAQHHTQSTFLNQCFKNSNDEIRTMFLSSDSFIGSTPDESNPAADLSMISAIIYESIHLDEHFAIIVNDAEQLSLQVLDELIKLALGINTSKNNVNFILSGGPGLLSLIQQISDIRRLGIAHCSLDDLTEDDIGDYVDEKQSNLEAAHKLRFNKYALKKICSQANGSLFKASILLEWCRVYALHTSNLKVTSKSIDELLGNIPNADSLASYPPLDYDFLTAEHVVEKTENVEFTKQDMGPIHTDNFDVTTEKTHTATSKTVYVETNNPREKQNSNVIEKIISNTIQDRSPNIPVNDGKEPEDTEDKIIETVVISSDEANYQDNYRLEALKQINDPLPFAPEDLHLSTDPDDNAPTPPAQTAEVPERHKSTAFIIILICLSILAGAYYVVMTNSINYNYFGSLSSVSGSVAAEVKENNLYTNELTPQISTEIPIPPNPSKAIDKHSVQALLDLADEQIQAKKLTTPPNDNALYTFNKILASHPSDKNALAGIEKIKVRYQTWAKLDITDGKFKRAKYFLSRALLISPNDTETRTLLSSLE